MTDRPPRDLEWSAYLYLLLVWLFMVTHAFGIWDFGPGLIHVVGASALVGTGVAVVLAVSPPPLILYRPEWALVGVGALGLFWNWGWKPVPGMKWWVLGVLWAAGALLAIHVARTLGWLRDRFPLWPGFLVAAAVFYAAIIVKEPVPNIDVWDHLNRGGDAVLLGENPYAIPIPDYYGGEAEYGFDAPGFPYPPLVLGVATLARGLGVDVRFLFLACTLLGAWLARKIALRAGWSRGVADLVLMLYLFVPRQSFVVKYSHSEPLTGLLLATAVYLFMKDRRTWGLVALGLFAGSKQYLSVLAPLLLLFARTPGAILVVGLAAALPWLPFALADGRALWNAAFDAHLSRPVRRDALTLNAWLLANQLAPIARWIPLAAGLVVATLAGLRRGAVALLPLGIACTLIVTLFLSPQAFANYYLLVAWALILAIASSSAR